MTATGFNYFKLIETFRSATEAVSMSQENMAEDIRLQQIDLKMAVQKQKEASDHLNWVYIENDRRANDHSKDRKAGYSNGYVVPTGNEKEASLDVCGPLGIYNLLTSEVNYKNSEIARSASMIGMSVSKTVETLTAGIRTMINALGDALDINVK